MITLYANIKGNPIGIPVEHHQDIIQVMTSQDFERTISVNKFVYCKQLRTIYSSNKVKTIIGNVLTMTSPVLADNAKDPVPITINIDVNGTLKEQIDGFRFVLAVAENDGFEIDGVHVPISLKIMDLKKK